MSLWEDVRRRLEEKGLIESSEEFRAGCEEELERQDEQGAIRFLAELLTDEHLDAYFPSEN